MKKITVIFAALAFVLGIAAISCTKQSTTPDPAIADVTDAVSMDNTVSDITGTVSDYQTLNPTIFADPTLKAASADPIPTAALALDKCATVSYTRVPVMTANAVTGATVNFSINFGTTGCVGKDGKTRTGTIVSNLSWVKAGGWSGTITFDLFINGIHHVGYVTSTYGVTGPNNHVYITEAASMIVTLKDGTTRQWNSNRQRELVEGNSPTIAQKIWKVTGSSSFTNVKGVKSTFTINDALYRISNCQGFSAGSTTAVSTAGVTTTVDYGAFTSYAALTCPTGFTVKAPGSGVRGAINTFIKWGK